jgi:hypothetical protein
MKKGRSIQNLANEIERQAKSKADYMVRLGLLSMKTSNESSVLTMEDPNPSDASHVFGITELMHDQIGSWAKIPSKYYERMRQDAPSLLSFNVNHWFNKNTNVRKMIRTLDGNARAFLSDKFRPLDNWDFFNACLPIIQKMDCRIESCEITERRLYLKIVTEKIQGNIGDIVQAGALLTNSEVGCGALSIKPLLFTLKCTNGAVMDDASLRKYHVGRKYDFEDESFYRNETIQASNKALWMKVEDTLSGVLSETTFNFWLDKMKLSKSDGPNFHNISIEDGVNKITRDFSLQESERSAIFSHLIAGGDLTNYGIGNAITRTAQDVPSYDRSTELEGIGFEVMQYRWN